ncbi:MBL fold metallo-hydrolase [Fervidicoccus fontis]|uniref:Beta-lactamase domain protein n=2 Tax=Fervidicoccus fontis TaxID=683846 RepID=H9ZZI6_FERFK|nr:MBL fold metallo-hydrolase [Fervidicoccus fontis]AFH42143.1 beta-lactamase domain protein [Fervidicoccus fontis Kam940]MBE9390896.1 MBL fold metallo-hydrolase [Fervidicoccus fontis]
MEILFIGTGAGGSPGSNRWRASSVVFSEETALLIDCGVGCHYRLGERGLLKEIDAIFITHYHMDHFLGLPELLFQAHIEKRSKPLKIIGPNGIESMIRTAAPHLFSNISFSFSVETVKVHETYKLNDLTLIPAPACHTIESYGLKILDKRGNSLGFSSDTSEPCESLISVLKGVKYLVHEATCDERNKDLCHKYGHSTVLEAIEAAKAIGAEKLILNHIDENFNNLNSSYQILPKSLNGKVIFANDLDRIILS